MSITRKNVSLSQLSHLVPKSQDDHHRTTTRANNRRMLLGTVASQAIVRLHRVLDNRRKTIDRPAKDNEAKVKADKAKADKAKADKAKADKAKAVRDSEAKVKELAKVSEVKANSEVLVNRVQAQVRVQVKALEIKVQGNAVRTKEVRVAIDTNVETKERNRTKAQPIGLDRSLLNRHHRLQMRCKMDASHCDRFRISCSSFKRSAMSLARHRHRHR